jgi:hypothetical protein
MSAERLKLRHVLFWTLVTHVCWPFPLHAAHLHASELIHFCLHTASLADLAYSCVGQAVPTCSRRCCQKRQDSSRHAAGACQPCKALDMLDLCSYQPTFATRLLICGLCRLLAVCTCAAKLAGTSARQPYGDLLLTNLLYEATYT